MKKRIIWLTVFTLLIGCLALTGCGNSKSGNSDPVKVTCHNGVMLGQEEDGVNCWKGIPYAEPPVDDLRWKAPVAAAESDEEIECYEFGYTALQYEWPTEPASYEEKDEDCLTLNIWTGAEATEEPKAVMVWFHGGSHAWGGTVDPIYDGKAFVEEHPDVVLVTANYRLGMMAWPDFTDIPGGEEYTDLNLGIRDHILALEWVQENIEGFGGDPDNVTIYGESAGGMSTACLLVSPMAEGLFNNVIIQSGGMIASPEADGTAEAKEFANVIMEAAGAKTMDDLLALSTEELLALDEEVGLGDYSCGAFSDGVVVPYEEELQARYQDAADRGVKLMLGANADEYNYFMVDAFGDTKEEQFENWSEGMTEVWDSYYEASDENKALMDEFAEIHSERIGDTYPEQKDALIKSSLFTEAWRLNHQNIADTYSDCGGEVYMYYWGVPSTSDDYYKSACHAVELAYMFNNLHDTIYCGEDPDKATAEKAHNAWANFAKNGNPSIEDTEWTTYNSTDRNTMMIQLDGWSMESDPLSRSREIMTLLDTDIF